MRALHKLCFATGEIQSTYVGSNNSSPSPCSLMSEPVTCVCVRARAAAEKGVCSDVNAVYLSLLLPICRECILSRIRLCGGYCTVSTKGSWSFALSAQAFVTFLPSPHSPLLRPPSFLSIPLFLECTLTNSFPLLPSLPCSPTDLFYGAPSKTGGVFTA